MGTLTRTLLLASILLAAGRAEAYLVPGMEADLLAIASDLENGKDVKAKVAAFRKKYNDFEELSQAYKPRAKGGVGVGPDGKSGGIELKLLTLAKRPLNPTALGKEKADLLRMARVNQAVAALMPAYTPAGGRGAAWRAASAGMAKSAQALIDALLQDNPDAVKKAAIWVNKSCTACH